MWQTSPQSSEAAIAFRMGIVRGVWMGRPGQGISLCMESLQIDRSSYDVLAVILYKDDIPVQICASHTYSHSMPDLIVFSGQFGGSYTLKATNQNTIVNFPSGMAISKTANTSELFIWKRVK